MNELNRVILAMDIPDMLYLNTWADSETGIKILERVSYYKIGSVLFTKEGPSVIEFFKRRGKRVFLDLKFHDIPNTVMGAIESAVQLDVDMINLHTSGGLLMMQEAVDVVLSLERTQKRRPLLIGVTVLTSLDDAMLNEIGFKYPVNELVMNLAGLANRAGLDGVVASAHEVGEIKGKFGPDFIVVTPGIRLPGKNRDDQKRVKTPKEALAAGADYLVMGRPILKSESPSETLNHLFD